MSIIATGIALFIFIAATIGYFIHIKKRTPDEKLPLIWNLIVSSPNSKYTSNDTDNE